MLFAVSGAVKYNVSLRDCRKSLLSGRVPRTRDLQRAVFAWNRKHRAPYGGHGTALPTLFRRALELLAALGAILVAASGLTALPQSAPVAPRLESIRATDAGVRLGWGDLGPEWRYVVQASENVNGVWITPDWVEAWPREGNDWTDDRSGLPSTRFFRVLAVEAAERGKVIETERLGSFEPNQIQALLAFAGVEFEPIHGVEIYRLVYETIDPLGNPALASGAFVVPAGVNEALPFVTYQHGTLAARAEAPSEAGGQELMLGVAFASLGYAASLPDYLGLGSSISYHPYHHAKSQATSAVDMLRAARAAAAGMGVSLNHQLFLVGYSQGGHATLALLREIETFHAAEFPVTAAAPMAGAYDLAGVTADDILSGRPHPNPYYVVLLLAAYQEIYHLEKELQDLLAEPWRLTVPPLLTGGHTGAEINAAMPDRVLDALNPKFVQQLREDPRHPMRQVLEANSLLDWTPRSPLRLYHCSGDQDVPFANSIVAREAFAARGAEVELVDPAPGANHGGCVLPSLLDAMAWFESLRERPN